MPRYDDRIKEEARVFFLQGMGYKTIANKTFSFTKEQREYVLSLRGLKLEDGNEYARGNYKMGEWCAD